MSPIKKNLFIYALVFFSIIISIFIWKKLHIPYNSDIIGEYSIKNYHPLNDVIKYLSFILLPVLAFISAKTFFDKIELFEKLEKIKIKNEYVNTNKIMRYVLFILSSFLVLEFTSVNFPTDKSYSIGQHRVDGYLVAYWDSDLKEWDTGSAPVVGLAEGFWVRR